MTATTSEWAALMEEATEDDFGSTSQTQHSLNDNEFWMDLASVNADDIIARAIQKKRLRDLERAERKAKAGNRQINKGPTTNTDCELSTDQVKFSRSPLTNKLDSTNDDDINVTVAVEQTTSGKRRSSSCEVQPIKRPHKSEPFVYQIEEDPLTLARRQKQVDYGKNTLAYQNYIKTIPKNKRTRHDPKTPQKTVKYSRRSFDQQIKLWRKNLHKYEPGDAPPPSTFGDSEIEMSASDISEIFSDFQSDPLRDYSSTGM